MARDKVRVFDGNHDTIGIVHDVFMEEDMLSGDASGETICGVWYYYHHREPPAVAPTALSSTSWPPRPAENTNDALSCMLCLDATCH